MDHLDRIAASEQLKFVTDRIEVDVRAIRGASKRTSSTPTILN